MYINKLTSEQLFYILNEEVTTKEQKENAFIELVNRNEIDISDPVIMENWHDYYSHLTRTDKPGNWADRMGKRLANVYLKVTGKDKVNKAKTPDDPTKYMGQKQKDRWEKANPIAADQVEKKLPATGEEDSPSYQQQIRKQNSNTNKTDEPSDQEFDGPIDYNRMKKELGDLVDKTFSKSPEYKSPEKSISEPNPVTQPKTIETPKPVVQPKTIETSKPVTQPKTPEPIKSPIAQTFKKTTDTFKKTEGNLDNTTKGFENASAKLDRLFAGSRIK